MKYQNILIEKKDRVSIITINRPDKLNALNKRTIEELHSAFEEAGKDDTCRVIILTGSGDKAFVAGADISEFASFTVRQGEALAREGQALLFDFVAALETPVIAAVNGYALGGGLELAMAAHVRIASENARMGLPEVSLGVIPGYGGTQRLTDLVGRGKALEMIMTAGMIEANDAYHWGLVNAVVKQEDLLDYCLKLAGKISRNSGTAISAAIRSVNAYTDKTANGYKVEIKEFGKLFATDDFKEGTTAFLEKRKPKF
jgi:enoyl-CoA hydratase